MTHDDITSTAAEARASELIEQAIASAQAGEHEAAIADLAEAERIASEAGVTELVTAARINQGWVYFDHGDMHDAVRLYRSAVEHAREHEDLERLRIALANLAVGLRAQERWSDAAAVLEDYLLAVGEESPEAVVGFIDRALCFMELEEYATAIEQLEKAEPLAQAAEDAERLLIIYNAQGFAYERNFDPGVAVTMYMKAAKIARELGDETQLIQALIGIAESRRALETFVEADAAYAEAEEHVRAAGETHTLADLLYWHASVLNSAGDADRALELWREEEGLRRELGQDADLGDSLLAQAMVHRLRREHDKLPPLYDEAEAAYRRADALRGVADVLHWRSMAARRTGDSAQARAFAEEVLDIVTRIQYPELDIQARGIRAMTLADAGEFAAANEDLDRADESCHPLGLDNLAVWIFARRAYVWAKEGRPAEEVVAQLDRAFGHAAEKGIVSIGKSAVRAMSAEIKARVGDSYAEALDELQDSLVSDWRSLEPPAEG